MLVNSKVVETYAFFSCRPTTADFTHGEEALGWHLLQDLLKSRPQRRAFGVLFCFAFCFVLNKLYYTKGLQINKNITHQSLHNLMNLHS